MHSCTHFQARTHTQLTLQQARNAALLPVHPFPPSRSTELCWLQPCRSRGLCRHAAATPHAEAEAYAGTQQPRPMQKKQRPMQARSSHTPCRGSRGPCRHAAATPHAEAEAYAGTQQPCPMQRQRPMQARSSHAPCSRCKPSSGFVVLRRRPSPPYHSKVLPGRGITHPFRSSLAAAQPKPLCSEAAPVADRYPHI